MTYALFNAREQAFLGQCQQAGWPATVCGLMWTNRAFLQQLAGH